MSNERPPVHLLSGEAIVVTDYVGSSIRVTAPGIYTPPPLWLPPPGAAVILPGVSMVGQLSAGLKIFYLRSGIHRFALGSTPTKYRDVSILAYPGDSPVIDGTGLDPHLVYLDKDSGTWTLGVEWRGFNPVDSAVIGVGNGCRLVTVKGFKGTGMNTRNANSHGVYFHGTGTGLLTDPDLRSFPGAAITSYRGSPQVKVERGWLGGLYETVQVYSGVFTFVDTDFVEPAAAWDIHVGGDSTGSGKATLSGCTGTGPGGTVRRVG